MDEENADKSAQRPRLVTAGIACSCVSAVLAVAYLTNSLFSPDMSSWGLALIWLAFIHLIAVIGITCSAFGRSPRMVQANIAVIAVFWIYGMLFSRN